MAAEKPSIHLLMIQHLLDLMSNAKLYGWELVRAFHVVWLQQLEQGRVTWANEEVKLRYIWALVWHHAAGPSQTPPAKKQVYNTPAKPGSRAYERYNDGTCRDATPHAKELHAC